MEDKRRPMSTQSSLLLGSPRIWGSMQTKGQVPLLLACMLTGANQYVFREWLLSQGKGDLAAEIVGVVDEAGTLINELLPRSRRKRASGKRAKKSA